MMQPSIRLPKLIGLYSSVPQSGKTVVANYLMEKYGYHKLSFAKPLKEMLATMLTFTGMTRDEAHAYVWNERNKALILPGLKPTLRHALQTLGTEWGRDNMQHDLWLKLAELQLDSAVHARWVCDDMRFPNEAQMLFDHRAQLWRINRVGALKVRPHPSEGQLDGHEFHHIIWNDNGLDELKKKVDEILG